MYALWIFGIVIFTKSGEPTNPDANSTDRRYLVEYSDYLEVPSFQKHDRHFDYYNFVPDATNGSSVVIFKCCPQGQHFDVDNYRCARGANSTRFDIFDKIQNGANESNYQFVENLPDCGNRSVLSVQTVSRMGIDPIGVVVNRSVFSKYCIDEHPSNPHEVVVLTCNDPDTFCRTRSCFRKCCQIGHSYASSSRKCQKTNRPFHPDIYNLSTLTLSRAALSRYGIYLGDACGAKGKYVLERDEGEVSYLGLNGLLFAPTYERNYTSDDFCLEYVEIGNRSGVETFLCFSKSGSIFENSQLQFFLLSLGFIVSCMFLLLTFLVYLFSPKSQNLYGKTLMCYVACLFAAYLCLAVVELMSRELNKKVCTNMGYSMLFSFLAAFFWLNVMSFDIWKTFRLDRTVERSKSEKGKLQFLWYSLYAWSFPSAITAVCAYVNQTQTIPYESIKPYIGEENCWFTKKTKGIYVFFIIPISLIITSNIVFYVQTAWKIWNVKADLKKIEKQKTKKFSDNKDQFIINGKLFIVMGITWSLEIISFFAPHPIWYITDTANALHGVFIFAVFVLKKKVLRQVSQRMRAPLKRMRQLTSSNSEDLSTARKNFQDLQTEGKSSAIVAAPAFESKN